MNNKSSAALLVLLIALSAIAAGTDQAESEQRWLSMSGPAVKTLADLQAHNAGLPPPTEARDTGLRLRVLTYNIHNFRGYPEDLGTARWKSHPEDKLDYPTQDPGDAGRPPGFPAGMRL